MVPRNIIDLLRQGVTPEKLALSLALGAALGVFPVIGTTTALCAIAALVLRLNLPAIQLVNYVVYPAQIALLIPFFRLGEWIFRAPRLPLSITQVAGMFRGNYWHAIRFLSVSMCHAAVAWCLLAPFGAALLYVVLLLSLQKAAAYRKSEVDR